MILSKSPRDSIRDGVKNQPADQTNKKQKKILVVIPYFFLKHQFAYLLQRPEVAIGSYMKTAFRILNDSQMPSLSN